MHITHCMFKCTLMKGLAERCKHETGGSVVTVVISRISRDNGEMPLPGYTVLSMLLLFW